MRGVREIPKGVIEWGTWKGVPQVARGSNPIVVVYSGNRENAEVAAIGTIINDKTNGLNYGLAVHGPTFTSQPVNPNGWGLLGCLEEGYARKKRATTQDFKSPIQK